MERRVEINSVKDYKLGKLHIKHNNILIRMTISINCQCKIDDKEHLHLILILKAINCQGVS